MAFSPINLLQGEIVALNLQKVKNFALFIFDLLYKIWFSVTLNKIYVDMQGQIDLMDIRANLPKGLFWSGSAPCKYVNATWLYKQ